MKFPLQLSCQQCGQSSSIEFHLDDDSPEWVCQCGQTNYLVFGLDFSVGYKILLRSEGEFRHRKDYSMSIVMSATALDCELSRVFFKWKQIAALRANREPDDEAIERMLRRFKSMGQKIEKVCRLLDEKGIDEFVRSSDDLRDTVANGFPSLRIGSLAKDFQEKVFWPRNAILHAGYTKYGEQEAARCHSFARLGLDILRQMDEAKRKTLG